MTQVIRTAEDALKHDPAEPALIEVPGELVRTVIVITNALAIPGHSKQKKMIKALLLAAATHVNLNDSGPA